ncbi:phosphonate C-P lyase system protein PhnH [Frigidibacter sp. MR17.14]|uniref:phosphonate C-P lyase system protein PhnH n=1 Tax=Frigidibacter sp. MR17.14 TaxID=3126509 RepID=UPI003012DD04
MAAPASVEALTGGFDDPPRGSARAFREILEAMARPGTIRHVAGATPPAGLSPAAGAALLVLADRTTPVFLAPGHDGVMIRDWLAFHTGAPVAAPEGASFALGRWPALAPLDRFPLGDPAYPDRSVTLIVEMDGLSPEGARLTGPGIETEARLSLPETAAFAANRRLFPLGFDVLLTCGDALAALPRTTRVEAG